MEKTMNLIHFTKPGGGMLNSIPIPTLANSARCTSYTSKYKRGYMAAPVASAPVEESKYILVRSCRQVEKDKALLQVSGDDATGIWLDGLFEVQDRLLNVKQANGVIFLGNHHTGAWMVQGEPKHIRTLCKDVKRKDCLDVKAKPTVGTLPHTVCVLGPNTIGLGLMVCKVLYQWNAGMLTFTGTVRPGKEAIELNARDLAKYREIAAIKADILLNPASANRLTELKDALKNLDDRIYVSVKAKTEKPQVIHPAVSTNEGGK
jgi:hypothetical protein